MVDRSSPVSETLIGNLPLQYIDGPDYCTVKDATGADFALTVQPELMQMMEQALLASAQTPLRTALDIHERELTDMMLDLGLRSKVRTIEVVFAKLREASALSVSSTEGNGK